MKIFDQFYDYLKNQKRYSEHTVKNYSLDLDKFKQYLIENNLTSLANLTEHDILNFLYAQAQEKSLSGTTINRKLSAIRHFFKYLKKHHNIINNEIELIKNNSQKSDNPTALSQDKIFEILDYLKQEAEKSWEKQQEYALFMLIYAMGLRISEALGLKVSDFDSSEIIIQGKGNKQRKVPVLEDVKIEVLKAYNNRVGKTLDKSSPVFLSTRNDNALNARYVQRFIEKIRKLFLLDDSFTPHTIRHCFATHLLQNGVQINDLKTLLGHENISTTQRYLHVDFEKIVKEHQEHHPLEN
jgi:integrase/recombinase XerC